MNIIDEVYKYGYKVFTRPYELNIVAYRTKNRVANKFDDYLFVFYKDNANRWITNTWQITTDPGTKSLKFPVNSKGTAILVAGQYLDSHRLGLHQGKYKALTQMLPVRVYRDSNRDNILDLRADKIFTGVFGINVHKAGLDSIVVEGWSAGCCVFKKSKDFDAFMTLCSKHARLYGTFTLTLINE